MADSSATLHGRRIALALQGGGSHGAYTWGVLDRILEEATLDIAGITGTSAGAMNAVVLADGLVRGGAEGARRNLRTFWETIGRMPGFASFLGPMAGETAAKVRLEYTPVYVWWDMVSRNLSPYDLNPARFNPLRGPLERMIDFDRLGAQDSIQIMVGATNARTARRRVFTNPEISVDAVLASACLPQLFPARRLSSERLPISQCASAPSAAVNRISVFRHLSLSNRASAVSAMRSFSARVIRVGQAQSSGRSRARDRTVTPACRRRSARAASGGGTGRYRPAQCAWRCGCPRRRSSLSPIGSGR